MILQPSQHRAAAKQRLSQAQKPGRAILLHTVVVLLFSLLVTAIDYYLDQQISNTGGLRGMESRAILQTIQLVLQILQMILLPFWQVGYTYYVLQVAHGRSAGGADLLQGFRRFGPVLRLKAIMALMTVILIVAASYASSFLFMMTPWGAPMMQELETMMASGIDDAALIAAFAEMTETYALPIFVLFCLSFLAGGVFLFFRFRFAELWLMDHPDCKAREAMRGSRKALRGNWKALLRIDLGFWWFYLLELLITVLGFGDLILDAIGFEMTTDAFLHFLVFYLLYAWMHTMLYWWKRNHVSVTYAHAYLTRCAEVEAEEEQVAV